MRSASSCMRGDDAELRLLASGLGVRAETVITERVPHTPLQWMCSGLTCFFRMPRMSGNGCREGPDQKISHLEESP